MSIFKEGDKVVSKNKKLDSRILTVRCGGEAFGKDVFLSYEMPYSYHYAHLYELEEEEKMIMSDYEFKVGDEVEVIVDLDSDSLCKKGDILKINSISGDMLWFGDDTFFLFKKSVKPVANKKIHPHHDVIIAWLNGSDIQYYCEYDGWKDYYSVEDCVSGERGVPSFMEDTQIRIKPKQSERNLEIERLEQTIKDAQDSIKKLKEMK